MDQSIVDTEKVFTQEELFKAAMFIRDAAIVANLLLGVSMSEREMEGVMGLFSTSLSVASDVLTSGLDPIDETISDLAESKEAS